MNWHNRKCSGIVCSCSTERGIRERENDMSGIVIEKVRKSFDTKDGVVEALIPVIYMGLSVCREQVRVHWYDV